MQILILYALMKSKQIHKKFKIMVFGKKSLRHMNNIGTAARIKRVIQVLLLFQKSNLYLLFMTLGSINMTEKEEFLQQNLNSLFW
jgi:hypothetical protein